MRSLEIYNTVCHLTATNNKLENLLTEQQLKQHGVDTQLAKNDTTTVANL